jgi:hypothetical protein
MAAEKVEDTEDDDTEDDDEETDDSQRAYYGVTKIAYRAHRTVKVTEAAIMALHQAWAKQNKLILRIREGTSQNTVNFETAESMAEWEKVNAKRIQGEKEAETRLVATAQRLKISVSELRELLGKQSLREVKSA